MLLNILMDYAINKRKITKEELVKGLEKNHIPHTQTASGNTKIFNFAPNAKIKEYIVRITDDVITSIYQIVGDDEIELIYDYEYHSMYELLCITLVELAKENCEMTHSSLKRTINNLVTSNGETNRVEFLEMESDYDRQVILKIGPKTDLKWHFSLKVRFINEDSVKIEHIKHFTRDVYLYGEYGGGIGE